VTEPGVVVAPLRARVAFCFYDFANSAFPTVLVTAFGAPYFQGVLVGPGGLHLGPLHLGPSSAWGVTVSLSMLLVTLSSPVLGALADRTGSKRLLLSVYTLLAVAACYGLAFVAPGQALLAAGLYVLANVAFEGSYVFYNAFLPELVPADCVGRLSGYAWAFGYVGGLGSLLLVRPLLPPAYDAAHASGAAWIYVAVATWYLVFAAPALLFLRDAPCSSGGAALPASPVFAGLVRTLRDALRYRHVALFVLAAFLYTDALNTFIEFTGVFTKEALSFSPGDNVSLFLVLNVIAAPGALLFGVLVDRVGARRSIALTLLLWMAVVAGAAWVREKSHFWPVAGLAAVVLGATQSASRSFMARIAPRRRMGEFMGLLTLAGKASSVFGPTLYGLLADAFGTDADRGRGHRIAIAAVGSLFVLALIVLLRIDEDAAVRAARVEDAAS
jgi:UMF1 family MFS transporter